jgi:hypothetical protein
MQRTRTPAPQQSAPTRTPSPSTQPELTAPEGAQVQGSDLTDRSGTLQTAAEDLGEVQAMDGGFYRTAGALIDVLLPNEGDKGKLQLNLNIPVDQTGTVRVAFEFIAEAERDENGVKGKIQVGGGVQARQEIDAYFFTADVFARAMVFGYIEASGDNGEQMWRLMALGIQNRIDAVSSRVADAVFERRQIEATIRGMDDNDYVETGMGVSVSAGVGISTPDGNGGEDTRGAGAGVTAQSGTRLESNGRGGLRARDTEQVEVALQGNCAPFGLEGKIVNKWLDDRYNALEVEVAGEASLGGEELTEVLVGGRWLSGMIGTVQGMITRGSGMVQDGDARRQIGSMAQFVGRNSGVGVLAEAASARAIDRLSSMGASLGHKLSVKGTWERGKGFGLEINLERTSNIEIGDSPRDTVYVLLENVQRVFKITV